MWWSLMKCTILSSQKNKCWIWKATTTLADTTRLVDVEVGDRSNQTLKPLYEQVGAKFKPCYTATLPEEQHATGKDLTYTTVRWPEMSRQLSFWSSLRV